MANQHFTVDEVAKLLGITVPQVYFRLKDGSLRGHKIPPGKYLFPIEQFNIDDADVETTDNVGTRPVSNTNESDVPPKTSGKPKPKSKKHPVSHRHKTKKNLGKHRYGNNKRPLSHETVWDKIASFGGTNGRIIKINAGHGRR